MVDISVASVASYNSVETIQQEILFGFDMLLR
jgi:hypothetical protein